MGEIFDLEGLADDCAADGRYEFLFSAAPLPITGGVGSPVNPVAIK
jgi:kynurenine formamidase